MLLVICWRFPERVTRRLDMPEGECYPSPIMNGKRFFGFFFMQHTRTAFVLERGSA